MVALENITFTFNTQGCGKPSLLKVENFETGVIKEGEYKGIHYVWLKETYAGQKNQALTLNHYLKDASNTKKKTFLCPFNADPLSCYQTTLQMIRWRLPASICGEGDSVC
mmetsp:Transcript_68275/g.138830  ORF Transcript_68275/g.138830 Transcript_68275/m.138830 type:complete len:110 (+) Transcript_68275:272-601(+)